MPPLLSFRPFPLLTVLAIAAPVPAQTQLYQWSTGLGCFGRSVAALGDTDGDGFIDVAVGEPVNCDASFCNGQTGGRVRIYSGRDGTVLQTIVGTVGTHLGNFGFAVAATGDLNADGHADLIVGDPLWGVAPQCGQGRAVVCSGFDGSVLYTILGTGVPNGSERFGYSVAGAGDVNADGTPDVIVGSIHGLNFNQIQAGYAVVCSGIDGTPLYALYGIQADERMGWSVAGVGDLNMDGHDDVAVGTPWSAFANQVGSVRVYSGADGLLMYFLTGGGMGSSVCGVGTADNDSVPDFAVGSANGARLYSGNTGFPLHTMLAGGGSVAAAGDLNGDFRGDLLVGYEQGSGQGVRVYSGTDGALITTYSYSSTPGLSAASTGADLNQDGRSDVVAGFTAVGQVHAYLTNCPIPETYCSAKLNSLGCLPSIGYSGVMSVSVGTDNFNVVAQNVRNNMTGLMFWGEQPANVPFGGGIRCVGTPLVRTPAQTSGGSTTLIDCSGSYSFHFSRAYAASFAVVPGTTLYCQYWSRDPGYSPPNNVGLTAGLRFTVLP